MNENTRTPEIIRASQESGTQPEPRVQSEITRTPRESEIREQSGRPSDAWIPVSALPLPTPQDGFVFRWVRTSQLGKSDNANVSKQFREGWVPVKKEDHPEFEFVMSDIDSQFKGNVEIGGLLLCKAPAELMAKRDEHFRRIANSQMESVDQNYMKENDPRMPMLQPERRTRTTFGRG